MAKATARTEEEQGTETKKRKYRKRGSEEQADTEQPETTTVVAADAGTEQLDVAVATVAKAGESEEQPYSAPKPKVSAAIAAAQEQAANEDPESTHAKYERVKKGQLHITDLQRLSVGELHTIAKKENIEEYTALKKQDLIFRILKERIRQNGLMYGEGVLEVLPDGFGFLRNPEYNYLSSPDDIYVSPSQIRRFGLRSGNVVSGQIRPPKDSENQVLFLEGGIFLDTLFFCDGM